MIPYFIILLLSVFLFYVYQRTKSRFFAILCVLLLTLFIGLRSTTVGTDTAGYARMFQLMGSFSSPLVAASEISTEDGWNILNWCLYQIYPHYVFFFVIIGLLTVSSAVNVIQRESSSPVVSLFTYITLGFYLFGFAAMRQSLALAIYFMAIPYLLKEQFWRYALVVLLASTFHVSVLVALPLYFVFRIPYSGRLLFGVVVGSLAFGYFLPSLLLYSTEFDERYSVYTEIKGGGEMFAIFFTILAIFFWTQRNKILDSRQGRYDKLLMMLIVGAIIYLVVTITGVYGEVTRIAMYFQLSVVLLWAELYRYRKERFSGIFWGCCIIGHLLYYYMYLSRIGGIVPYLMSDF